MVKRCASPSLKSAKGKNLRLAIHPIQRIVEPRLQMAMTLQESLTQFAAQAIGERVRALTGSQSNLDDFATPKGDPGLFGPNSLTWRVHANFTAMMVGGLSSLMIQSLHPRALSAVWDHSDFRHQLKARLGRTAYFVAATTYGSQAMAMSAIGRVNAIHANIRGTDPHGQPYVANAPDLIRWVHLAEVSSFLNAFQYITKNSLPESECDQYIREMAQIGHLLGALDLPMTWHATQAELAGYFGVLRFDARAKEILRIIENYPTDLLDRPFMRLSLQAAFDVMPAWALGLIEKQAACALQRQVTQGTLCMGSKPIQWMLDQQGVSAVAHQRVGATDRSAGLAQSLLRSARLHRGC